jgi:hypothetical protein
MRYLIVAVCCAALVGSVSVASAKTSNSPAQQTVKANDPMNAHAMKMKKYKSPSGKKAKKTSDSPAPARGDKKM